AAQSLMNGGADVLMQNTDSSAVLQAAEKAGKYAFGWDSDMQAYAPNAHLASAVINWGPYYIQEVNNMLNGTWKSGKSWWGVKEGAIDIVSISDKVPPELKAKAEAAKAGLKDGTLEIWKGPIYGQDGKEVVKSGEVADDAFLGGIKFYVKGVDAKMPGEK
ncbi:MAG: BMP family ABC transporter substrate-binding protein, partial [Burkholderiales bacterium]